MEKLYERIDWHNDTTPALNQTNLNLMSKAIDDIDDRVVDLAGNITEVVAECNTKAAEAAASATAAAGSASRASTAATNAFLSANDAAGSKRDAANSAAQALSYNQSARSYAQDAQSAASNARGYSQSAYLYSQDAAGSATTATNKAAEAAGSATSAAASADRAASFSENPPYIGANGNWYVWNTTQGAYVDSGVDASITVEIADITMLAPTATPYVTNTGTDTDPIFHLFIPRGVGIQQIAKTSQSGLVDTYTILYTDGTTTTFTVTNGKTAYQGAVEGGYTGTEAEFNADLANFEEWASDAEDAAAQSAQSALDAANSASLAEQYADFVTPHFLIVGNELYIKDDAAAEFLLANNRLYMKIA